MRRLGRVTANLARHRQLWDALGDATGAGGGPAGGELTRLTETTGFGPNPGRLRMFSYVPATVQPAPALVVVLHGCTQSAAGYDRGAGWSTLADRYGFALLLPEQQRANNPKTCFSWFQPGDTARGSGEAASIRQMIERMVLDHGVDRSRIFVTGLSAGGAMTSAMLAAYPEVFAAGAIIAGLPYGAAANVQEAFDSMFNGRSRPAKEWGDLVRAASPHRGPWPRVSVWHGTADATVAPLNAQEIVKQWTEVHGVAHARPDTDEVSGYPRRVWRSRSGEALVEEYTITGMAHGTPLAPATAMDPHGEAGPFLLDVGIASSYHIAAFWGLTEAGEARARSDGVRSEPRTASRLEPGQPEPRREPKRPKTDAVSSLPSEIKGVITRALRSAGLMGP